MNGGDIHYSVEEGFDILLSNLEVPRSDYLAVAERQLEVENYLAKYINTFVTMLPGAYARKTLIAPLKAGRIDMLVLFKQEHSERFMPGDLLEKLYVTLRHPYPQIEVSDSNKGLILDFPECTFNVMPGFFLEEGGYLVPAMSGRGWIRSNPELYQRQLEQANREKKGLLIPAIKMLKCWNRSIDNIFNGYYLELLAMEILTDVPVTSHVSAIRHILDKGKKKVVFRAEDPAADGALVDGLDDINIIVQAMLCFQNAYGVSSAAVHHERRNNIAQAYEAWDHIFPGYFPTPVSMVIRRLQESEIEGARALQIMRDSMGK